MQDQPRRERKQRVQQQIPAGERKPGANRDVQRQQAAQSERHERPAVDDRQHDGETHGDDQNDFEQIDPIGPQ